MTDTTNTVHVVADRYAAAGEQLWLECSCGMISSTRREHDQHVSRVIRANLIVRAAGNVRGRA